MSSSSNDSNDSESAETQGLLLHQRYNIWISISQSVLKLKSLCRFSKAVYLILTWTLTVGAIYTGMLYLAAGFISTSTALRSNIFYQRQSFHIPVVHYTGRACNDRYALSSQWILS